MFNDRSTTPRHFRQLRQGPEAELQHAVSEKLNELFPRSTEPVWVGGSVPLGAGLPDIVRAVYEPELTGLVDADQFTLAVIAYLRAAGRARVETVSTRVGKSVNLVEQQLLYLERARIVAADGHSYSLTETWKNILIEVISIEVKVSDWRKALQQAARNRIFSNKSYIALPYRVAARVRHETSFAERGIGVLGVQDDANVRIIRQARTVKPKAWIYYYTLVSRAAHELTVGNNGISG